MGFPDYQIRGYEKSYITQEQILDFLGSYVDHYGLRNNIKVNIKKKNSKAAHVDFFFKICN